MIDDDSPKEKYNLPFRHRLWKSRKFVEETIEKMKMKFHEALHIEHFSFHCSLQPLHEIFPSLIWKHLRNVKMYEYEERF